ncbi:MAG: S8 family serine peptidase [Chloroflexota bacterium]
MNRENQPKYNHRGQHYRLLDQNRPEDVSNYGFMLPSDKIDIIVPPTAKRPKGLWWRRFIISLYFLWILLISWVAQLAGWGGAITGFEPPILNFPVLSSLAQATLIIVPLFPAVFLWKMPRYRAMTRLWLIAALYLMLLALTRLFVPTQSQFLLIAQIQLTVLFGLFISPFNRGKNKKADDETDEPDEDASKTGVALPLAMGATALLTLPWLLIGAVGSILDIALSLLLGLSVGWVARVAIERFWLSSLASDTRGPGRDIYTGGFVIGTALLVMASGLSMNGVQLLLMFILSASGWLLMGIASSGIQSASPEWPGLPIVKSHIANSKTIGWAVTVLSATVLIFTDTDGAILQALDTLLTHYGTAIGVMVFLALFIGILLMLRPRTATHAKGGSFALSGALALWVIAILVYITYGQSGLYGDRLFVVLHKQADVSAATTMDDYDERRQFVYNTLVNHANSTQSPLRNTLEGLNIDYTPYYLVNAIEIDGGFLTYLWLLTRNDVARIMPSPRLKPLFLSEPATSGEAILEEDGPAWNLTNIGADRVWTQFDVRGEDIVIGQSDSGVQFDHPELLDSYRGAIENGVDNPTHDYHWLDPWHDSVEPTDIGGHGTHTLGSVLGNAVGVAPDAQWIGCANLARNLGNPALYLDCMQFMLAPYPQAGNPLEDGDPTRSAHVLNNSWGCPEEFEGCDPESLRPAVAALRAAGIFVVASAGNSGPTCSSVDDAIAMYDEAFSVGAVTEMNDLAVFSSVGPVAVDGSNRVKPDILAPGADVLSAYPNSTYESNSGTSMAGPHVAGVVALLWSANPALLGDIDATERILQLSTTPFTGSVDMMIPEEMVEFLGDDVVIDAPPENACIQNTNLSRVPNNIAGFGIVNAFRAVQLALAEE